MIVGMGMFALKDGMAKTLVLSLHPAQIIWMQYTAIFIVIASITIPKYGLQAFRPNPLFTQFWRGLSAVAGVGLFYWALVYVSLAEAAAMTLTAPLVVTILSPFMLNERVGIRRIIAVIVGFIGVLVILRPGFGSDLFGLVIAFISGIMFGFNFIGNRMVAQMHPPLINIAYNVLIGTVVLAPFMPFVWQDIPPEWYSSLFGFLVFSLLGHSFMVISFKYAAAPVVAPYQYSTIIFATAVGYVLFGNFPDFITWIGIALIVGSGIFIAIREGHLSKSKT